MCRSLPAHSESNTTCEDLLGGDRGESPIILLVVVLSVLVRNNNIDSLMTILLPVVREPY